MTRELVETDDGKWIVLILDEDNTVIGIDLPTDDELKNVKKLDI